MKKLAKKFNLTYTYRTGWGILEFNNIKKNIIEGKIYKHKVAIYDVSRLTRYLEPVSKNRVAGSGDPIRKTVAIVDGKEHVLRGFMSGYSSIHKLEKFLENLYEK